MFLKEQIKDIIIIEGLDVPDEVAPAVLALRPLLPVLADAAGVPAANARCPDHAEGGGGGARASALLQLLLFLRSCAHAQERIIYIYIYITYLFQ